MLIISRTRSTALPTGSGIPGRMGCRVTTRPRGSLAVGSRSIPELVPSSGTSVQVPIRWVCGRNYGRALHGIRVQCAQRGPEAGASGSQGQAARASNFLSCERSEDRADVIAGCSLPPRDRSSAIKAPIAASSSRLSNTIDTYSFFVEPICRTFIF